MVFQLSSPSPPSSTCVGKIIFCFRSTIRTCREICWSLICGIFGQQLFVSSVFLVAQSFFWWLFYCCERSKETSRLVKGMSHNQISHGSNFFIDLSSPFSTKGCSNWHKIPLIPKGCSFQSAWVFAPQVSVLFKRSLLPWEQKEYLHLNKHILDMLICQITTNYK